MWRRVSKILLLLFLALPFAQSSYAKTAAPPDAAQDETYAKDYAAAKKLQQALMHNEKRAVADLIQYPLVRDQPLSPIKNSKDFLKHWDEYFDAANVARIATSEAEQYGWRGIAMSNGEVWFKDGRISSINLQTAAYKTALAAAMKVENRGLYLSAQGYDKVVFQCKTKNLSIRVQQNADSYNYFAWKKTAALSTKPELEIRGGKYLPQGTGGNYDMEFQNNDYKYTVSVGHNLCGEDCNDYLVVSKGDTQLSRDVCAEIKQ